eukprot:8113716-Pyramimonas_sp.AAC.1
MVLVCSDVLMYLRLGYSSQDINRVWKKILPPSPRMDICMTGIRLVPGGAHACGDGSGSDSATAECPDTSGHPSWASGRQP